MYQWSQMDQNGQNSPPPADPAQKTGQILHVTLGLGNSFTRLHVKCTSVIAADQFVPVPYAREKPSSVSIVVVPFTPLLYAVSIVQGRRAIGSTSAPVHSRSNGHRWNNSKNASPSTASRRLHVGSACPGKR
jgi:hypothetical protein